MKTFKIAALIPHGNIQSKLAQEQNQFCKEARLIKPAPFFCMLEKFETETQDSLILSKYQKLFHTANCVPKLMPLNIEHFRAFRSLNKETSALLSEETLFLGSFLFKTGQFLYGTAEITDGKTDNKNLMEKAKKSIKADETFTMKVFQIAVYTITENENLITWKLNSAKWIQIKQPEQT